MARTAQLNWSKVRSEISKIKDLDSLKKELSLVKNEVQKFDINSHISPSAKKRLKKVEKNYSNFLKSINGVQKQLDGEMVKAVKFIKTAKKDVEKKLVVLKRAAAKQKKKFDKVSKKIKAVAKKEAGAKKKTKKVSQKAGATKKTAKKTTVRVAKKKRVSKKA